MDAAAADGSVGASDGVGAILAKKPVVRLVAFEVVVEELPLLAKKPVEKLCAIEVPFEELP